MLVELQDFYKRRAEVEMDYSKALDRLVKQIMIRHKWVLPTNCFSSLHCKQYFFIHLDVQFKIATSSLGKWVTNWVMLIFCLCRRELWPGYSTYTAWQTLLSSTKRQSKDHAVLGEMYNNQMSNRFTELMEDIQRMYKKVTHLTAWLRLKLPGNHKFIFFLLIHVDSPGFQSITKPLKIF